jgi:hypothetical protein
VVCAAAAALAAAAFSLATHAPDPADRARVPSRFQLAAKTTSLRFRGVGRLRAVSWQGGARVAGTGETVTVYVSDAYPVDDTVVQGWADFFAGLVHGSELSALTAYVAPLPEVQSICGEHALGCYGGGRLVMVGDGSAGIDPKEVARHEYGHHVASNRLNPPWRAVDWGPKRWASYLNVCSRAAGGTAFPGDEDLHYAQNPGEAFAESYRALNDAKAGITSFAWPIVDSSFYPDGGALQAVEQDVLQPWAAETTTTARGRFSPKGKGVWTLAVATPLDGQLTVRLALPKGSLSTLQLLPTDGSAALGEGLWSGSRERTLTYEVCGRRSLLVRVTRKGATGPFTVRVSKP